ncbi:glutamate receptor-like isoform X1 [Haliotis rufescens]|uniref:glutamate receptor-like isoform X1 n=1 Tax=Haliotis rufescens TaxID=6454 RepID=UPI001EB067A2|nr:glutamate receptor-like isoform X1 [Haliotis rufescens]
MPWTMELWKFGFTWCVIFLLRTCAARNTEIHIGLMFDENSIDLETIVEKAIQRYNNKTESILRLESHTRPVNVKDSFNFTNAACGLLNSGAVALLGVSSRAVHHTIQDYTANLRAPFIVLNNPADIKSKYHSKYQIYIQPTGIRAMVDVIKTYNWEEVIYIYDTNEALAHIEQMHEFGHMAKHVINIDVRHVKDEDDCFKLLAAMHKKDIGRAIRVVLDLLPFKASKIINRIMRQQDILKMMFHFVIPHLELKELNLTMFKIGGVNITGFELNRDIVIRHTPAREAYAVDAVTLLTLSLEELQHKHGSIAIKNSFENLNSRMGNNRLIDCVKIHPWSYGDMLTQLLYEKRFSGNSGYVAFGSNGQRKEYQVQVLEVSMYRGTANSGTWNESGFHAQTPTLVIDKANKSIDNITQTVVTIKDPPYLMFKKSPEQGIPMITIERFEGFCVDLAEMVARNLGYDYFFRLVKDGNYGSKNESGIWNGIIGELIRHEADIAIAPLTITSEREKVLDFTKPYMSLGISIMIKKPENEPPHVFSFMEPLSQEIWLCTAFAFIGVSVVLFLVSRFSTVEWQVDGDEQKLTNDFTIGNSLWFSLGAFMQQGCDVLPKSVSGRMVTSVWWFFTLIVISSYTANLAAYLTAMRMSTPISSAEDLAKQTEIKYGTQKSGSTWSFFNGSTVSLYQRMMSFMTSQPDVFVSKNSEGIAKVRKENGKYAFLIESTTNDYHNQRRPCDTMQVGTNLDSKGYGIATPMGSDIRDVLTLAILELREQSKLDEIKKHWWYARSECPSEKASPVSKDSKDNALTLTKVAGIFYILIVGLGLSVLSAIFEFLYKTKVDSKKQNVSFGSEARSKFRLSISGHSDDESVGVRTPLRSTGGTFTYTGPDNVRKTQTIV